MHDNIREQALRTLQTQFGLSEFRPKQLEVIDRIFSRRHTLALLPTGYGKSICYQVPAQLLPGVTLVISPLIALMQDQLSNLNKRGITNATVLNSSLDYGEISNRIAGIRNGAYKLVYVAPERFDSPRFRSLLADIDISLMVVDEAHCISQWGHDFRPQYRNIGDYAREFGNAIVLAVTATATPTVKADIVRNLGLPEMDVVEGCFDRPNLLFAVREMSGTRDKDLLVQQLLESNSGSSIVYTSSRNEAERVGTLLKRSGFRAGFYHAGLPADRRANVQKAFESDRLDVIVCTVAFGMGVDKPNIRQVIHYNLPGSLESYYQEAGRAGRDGQQALCTLLFQPKDIYIHKWLIDKKDVTEELKKMDRRRLEAMIGYAQARTCRRDRILSYFGQRLNECVGCDICNASAVSSFTEDAPAGKERAVAHGADPKPRRSRLHNDGVAHESGLQNLILSVAANLSGKIGRTTYAQILAGSRAAKLIEKGFDQLPQFGAYTGHKQDDIVAAVDALVSDGCLSVSRGLYPKVSITRVGRTRLSAQ